MPVESSDFLVERNVGQYMAILMWARIRTDIRRLNGHWDETCK
jgi:hypothetical protein